MKYREEQQPFKSRPCSIRYFVLVDLGCSFIAAGILYETIDPALMVVEARVVDYRMSGVTVVPALFGQILPSEACC